MLTRLGSRSVKKDTDPWNSFNASVEQALASLGGRSSFSGNHAVFNGLQHLSNSHFIQMASVHLLTACQEHASQQTEGVLTLLAGFAGLDEEEEMTPVSSAESGLKLVAAVEEVAYLLKQHCNLMLAFATQAWQALKAANLTCPSMLHSLPLQHKTYVAGRILAHTEPSLQAVMIRLVMRQLELFYAAVVQRLETVRDRDMENTDPEDEDGDDEPDFSDYEPLSMRCIVEEVLDANPGFTNLTRLTAALSQIGLQDVSQQAFWQVVNKFMQEKVEEMASGRLDKSVIPTVSGFANAVILPFLDFLVIPEQTEETRDSWKKRIHSFVCQSVGRIRILDLFDIAASYPDSQSAVQDLQECMKQCDLHRLLVQTFRRSCATRLLIPGAKTNDIIDLYVSSIKILRQIDSTGLLLEAVSTPIHEYLQKRKDTIRCIMTAMTNDNSENQGESLYDELNRPVTEDEDIEGQQDDSSAIKEWATWVPETVSIDVEKPRRARQMFNIIAMLIQIYGSRDLFINEYRGMLAERLLAKNDFDNDSELRTLEHLKLRFGENNLHDCEVMMRDVADSKRLYNSIKSHPSVVTSPTRRIRPQKIPTIGPVTALIISELFWPVLQKDKLELHPEMETLLDEYAARFWVAKQPRKLVWKKHLGNVDLSLTVNGTSMDFSVSPFEATILLHFQDRGTWKDSELAAVMGMSLDTLNRKAAFWCKHGVLNAKPDSQGRLVYQRASNLSKAAAKVEDSGPVAMDAEDTSSALISEEDQGKQDAAMYEQYIIAMLTTFDAGLPLSRIHNNLKFFVPDSGYDKTIDELSHILGRLCVEEKIQLSGEVYIKR